MTDDISDALRPVDPAYRSVLRLSFALQMLPLCLGAIAIDYLVLRGNGLPWGFLTVLGALLLVIVPVVLPDRHYRHLRYAMDVDNLRVTRGFMFHVDTIVPFVRVQHIDVGQGPIERWAKVAHVVVHTAGTHNSTVTLPGLRHEDAVAMRDGIRAHIQTDFA